MWARIVEITQDKQHLALERGFMVVKSENKEVGRVPLDDIGAVIITAHAITHSSNILVALVERGIPFVLTGSNMNPVAILWSIDGNYQQSGRMDAQLEVNLPLKKRLWQQIIKHKLAMQAGLLSALNKVHMPVTSLIDRVKSGDPDNYEAQGAQHYWRLLMGDEFRRDRAAEGINSMLNYGYMVLRAAVARAIIAAGLHPGLGLHHSNSQNNMRLVDDLMEPFRPIVDAKVYALIHSDYPLQIDKETKPHLVKWLYADLLSDSGTTPVMGHIQRMTTSLAQVYLKDKDKLQLPYLPQPLEWAALLTLNNASSLSDE